MARQPAGRQLQPRHSPACQSSPLSAERSLLALLAALCLGLPLCCCRAPSERWVNLCPGNAAFPQLNASRAAQIKPLSRLYRPVLGPHLYMGQVTGAYVAVFRVGCQPPHQHLVNSRGTADFCDNPICTSLL